MDYIFRNSEVDRWEFNKITEELFQSYILWNFNFRIAEVDRWEFTTRSQRSSLPTLQCRLLINFPVIGKFKGQSHEMHLGALCLKDIQYVLNFRFLLVFYGIQ